MPMVLEAQKCKKAGKSRPSLQHITGHVSEVFVATVAQRLEREAWEANTPCEKADIVEGSTESIGK